MTATSVGVPFPLPCDCEIVEHGEPDLEFGGEEWGSGRLIVRVRPPGTPGWVGSFARGPGTLDAVVGAPEPERVCVVAGGIAWFVRVLAPSVFEQASLVPVVDLVGAPDLDVLVLVGLTSMQAYGPRGELWTSEEISWDGLRPTELDDGAVVAVAWDDPAEEEVPVRVDLRTGRHVGGAAPPP